MIRRICLVLTMICFGLSLSAQGANMTATLTVDQQTVYENQTFTLTLTVTATGYDFGQEMSLSPLTDNPGFQLAGKGQFQEKDVKPMPGQSIRQFLCQARVTRPGRISLAPVLSAMLQKKETHLFGYQWIRQQESTSVQPLVINVLPLPREGKPDDFSGAVGHFSFVASATPTNPVPGDLITLRSRIRGDGQLDGIRPPRVSPGKNFKIYDPETVEGSTATDLAVDQILIPQSTNAVAIPAISFCYFDPTTRKYKKITRGPFRLTFRDPSTDKVEAYIPPKIEHVEDMSGKELKTAGTRPSFSERIRGLFKSYPTAIVIADTKGRLAPAASALDTFDLPKTTVVQVLELSGAWAKIQSGNRRGWMPLKAIKIE